MFKVRDWQRARFFHDDEWHGVGLLAPNPVVTPCQPVNPYPETPGLRAVATLLLSPMTFDDLLFIGPLWWDVNPTSLSPACYSRANVRMSLSCLTLCFLLTIDWLSQFLTYCNYRSITYISSLDIGINMNPFK